MDNLELICFQMISNAGMAKSTFVEAMQEAEAGNGGHCLSEMPFAVLQLPII